MTEGRSVGPVRGEKDPGISGEERSLLGSFAEHHRVPPEEVRVASLLDPSGERAAMVIVVTIATMRRIARETGKFSGSDPPEFERDGHGLPAAATVRVHRTDLPRGLARTAFWHERAPRFEEGEPPGRWPGAPDTVLAEVAEALALRGAFPQALEGVYIEEDLGEALRDLELREVHRENERRRTLEALR